MSLSDATISSESDEQHNIPGPSRTFRDRVEPFNEFSEAEFKMRYRVSKPVVLYLVTLIGDSIKPHTLRSKSISALQQILLTISFFATGAFQITVADRIRLHKSTACRIIKKVSAAIAQLRPQFVKMPRTEEERNKVKSDFYRICLFPNVIGAIDCTHIKISSPGGPQAELYRNRKGYFSLNVQAICDANLKIMDVICRWPGSVHDTTILNDSHVRADFESGVYGSDYLLGDSGYPCRHYLLTPFLNPSTPSEEAFNRAQISTRNTIERCFGVLKRRFPCLSMGLRVKLETTMSIIVSCCILHNIAIDNNDNIDDEFDEDCNLPEVNEANVQNSSENTYVRTALLLSHFRQ